MTTASTLVPPATLAPEVRAAIADQDRVRTRMIDRVARASDASHYLFTPTAIIEAESAEEVARLLAASNSTGTPVTFRSGGTSLSGQASSEGLLVDVRKNFRKVTVLDGGERVRAGGGATIATVNAHLRRHQRRLGPDPASESAATVGGVVNNNSSGMACGTEQNTYKTLESMVLVLPSGLVLDTGDPGADARLREKEPEIFEGLQRLTERVRGNTESVQIIRERFALKNTMGYGINAFLDADSPVKVLEKLVIGSEGTLAFVAEATFRTVEIPRLTTTSLAVFESLESATRMLPSLVDSGAATLELMDSTSIRVGQTLAKVPPQIQGFAPTTEAALLIEYRSNSEEELRALEAGGMALLDPKALREGTLKAPVVFGQDPVARAEAWALRKGLYASVAGARASGTTALLEDVVVPPERLANTCGHLQGLFEEHGYKDSVIFGHAKDGNIHFMITDRFTGDSAMNRLDAFTESMVDVVLDAGGNLKAEHGTGRAMAPFVRRQYGDELYDVQVQLKHLVDPRGILNPGVLISDDARAHLENFKFNPRVEEEVDHCVECGYCEPVCPSKDVTLTPRQRIVVRRGLQRAEAAGDAELVRALEKDYEYDGIQTCAVDSMCQTACPLGINTAHLVKRLRREQNPAAVSALWQGAAKGWGALNVGAAQALTVATKLPTPVVRGATNAGRAILGDDLVPQYSKDLPAGGRARSKLGRSVGKPGGDVVGVFVPACVNTMFGGADGGQGATAAFLQIVAAAGVQLVVPEGIDGVCCGTPWSSKGQTRGYETNKKRSVDVIVKAVADSGLPVVSDASSCTEGFAGMLRDHGVEVIDAVAFTARHLLDILPAGPREGRLVLHPTCSSTQMGLNPDLEKVARAAFTDVVVPVNWGCCAFAGDRGMLHPELTASATAAEAAEVRALGAQAHSSCNRTCELGMTRATGRTYTHVLEELAKTLA